MDYLDPPQSENPSENPPQENPSESESKLDPFTESLKSKQVIFIDGLRDVSTYFEQPNDATPALTSRLNKEIKALTRGLPCYKSYSAFIGIDSSDMGIMRAAIAGSEGTPYAHGLFFFDIYCNSTFPESPPQFTLTTTGGGEAYFGPNLYNSGYVCLSIINTWSGDPEEMWSHDKNILQVILSIQALVMDNDIIHKEPGWEGSDTNDPDNIIYQNAVKYLNIRWAMLENLRNPPLGFAEIIDLYFRYKKDYILNELNGWLNKAKNKPDNYQCQGMAMGANPNILNRMASEGTYKVLSSIVSELAAEFEARYGYSDVKLDLYEENPVVAAESCVAEIREIKEVSAAATAGVIENYEGEIENVEDNIHYQDFEEDKWEEDQYSDYDEDGIIIPNLENVPNLFREPSASDPEAPDSTNMYFQHLGNLRLQLLDKSEGFFNDFGYDNSSIDESALARINKEIKALSRSLPCEAQGSVFVALNSSNLGMIKALISGPEDSPYEHGLFLFDIKLPQNYPNRPPEMTIKTTGNGTLRFNPNLYNTGFVCLSIINTWDGNPEEMWNPNYSTLLQVFLSIQALVMNNDVLQKEPGCEGYLTDDRDNMEYRAVVMYGNIKHAMIGMMRNPPPEFKEIVMKHFAIKKEKILESVQVWKEMAAKVPLPFQNSIVLSHNYNTADIFRNGGILNCYESEIEELKKELDKLPGI